jgi:hypothetical protein
VNFPFDCLLVAFMGLPVMMGGFVIGEFTGFPTGSDQSFKLVTRIVSAGFVWLMSWTLIGMFAVLSTTASHAP